MIKDIIPKLEEMPKEIRILVEYKMALNLLKYKVEEITNKYTLPNVNYRYFWDLEVEIRKANKKFRGW